MTVVRAFRLYGAAWVLVALALFFNALHYYIEVHLNPEQGTRAYWLNTTVENLQSECWQIVVAAFAFKYWRWKHTPDEREDAPNSLVALVAPAAVIVLFLLLLQWVIHP